LPSFVTGRRRTAAIPCASALAVLGTVDFSPERRIAAGTGMDAYPPSVAEPGSRGSETYRGYRACETEDFRILGLVQRGHITGPDGRPFGSVGGIITCPPMFRLL
jgi:hypothetical protein